MESKGITFFLLAFQLAAIERMGDKVSQRKMIILQIDVKLQTKNNQFKEIHSRQRAVNCRVSNTQRRSAGIPEKDTFQGMALMHNDIPIRAVRTRRQRNIFKVANENYWSSNLYK